MGLCDQEGQLMKAGMDWTNENNAMTLNADEYNIMELPAGQ